MCITFISQNFKTGIIVVDPFGERFTRIEDTNSYTHHSDYRLFYAHDHKDNQFIIKQLAD